MKNYIEDNNKILKEWEESNKRRGEENFAPDGIMYRGMFNDYGSGVERLADLEGKENDMWANSPLRILFLTKDQNAGGEDAWDVRGEVGDLSYAFFRNLMYQLYGLVNTKPGSKPEYDDFTNEDAMNLYSSYPIARINVKKEAGESSISNSVLEKYLKDDKEFIKKQILNLDSDIIICCGYSDSIENTGNHLLNFLINHCGYVFKKQPNNNWIYYDEVRNKLAINNWHLSVRYSSEKIYNEMITAYESFLSSHPSFLNNHRINLSDNNE